MTDTKRCARPSKGGCSQLLSVDKFKARPRKRTDGSIRMELNSRCIECEAEFQQEKGVRRRKNESQAKGAEFKISKAGEYFFCRVPIVPMGVELRRSRRENLGSL